MILGVNDPYTLQKRIARALDSRAVGIIREKTVNATYGALASVTCDSVVLTNTSGKDIFVRRGASGASIRLPNGSGKEMDVIADSNELQIANATDNTNATVQYECNGEVVA